MSAQPPQGQTHKRFGSRTSSRSILQSDVNMINHYARKYSTTYKNSPYAAVSPAYGGVSSAYGGNVKPTTRNDDTSSIASSKMSSVSQKGNNQINGMHAKRPSNLLNSKNHNLWNDNAMANQHQDMESAMENMIASYQTRLEKQAHFLDEIEREASQNKNFGKLENCDDWSNLEVCHWLTTIHLEKYIQSFADQIIDGSILIRDLDESILVSELGVKRIHVKKILREIEKLRQICPKFSGQNGSKDTLVESLKLEIQSLERENKHLREQIKSLQNNQNDQNSSHFSSNTSSMSSIQSYNNNNSNNNGNSNNSNLSKYSGYGTHGTASHNYSVNPRNYKKY